MKPDGTIEQRQAIEFRLDARRLEGYAAVFDTPAKFADFTETVARGAFAASLERRADVLALVDHDPRRLLARTRSGTLRLAEDQRGLSFSLDIPDTQLGRDMLALVQRGDIGGASFSFRVPKGGDQWQGRSRTLRQVELIDVSIVQAFPAYEGTSVAARARAEPRLSLALARRFLELPR